MWLFYVLKILSVPVEERRKYINNDVKQTALDSKAKPRVFIVSQL